jgi:Transposase DDE domain
MMKDIRFPRKIVASSDFLTCLADFFDEKNLQELALETKFNQRSSSRIGGLAFLSLQVFEEESLRNQSLNEACDFLEREFGIALRKQSLDERYNTYAIAFMKRCFGMVLKQVLVKSTIWSGFSDIFERVRLGDSTSFQLPANLEAFYQSGGGSTSPSSVKIHYEMDLLRGEFLDLQWGCGKRNDAEYLQNGPKIKPKDLFIKDLGYYQHKHFATIADGGGYFLSRFKSGACLWSKNEQGDFEKADLAQILSGVKTLSSKRLWLGEEKIEIRLVVAPVPEEVAQKRLQKLKKTAKHKKWKVSEERKLMCRFNIFVTNLDERVTDVDILRLYALRWQIELLFKIWKTIFKIHEIGHTNIFRFECYLIGRLIALCLAQNIQSIFKEHLLANGFEPSEWKGYKVIKKNCSNYSNLSEKAIRLS